MEFTNTREAALMYREMGLSVIPVSKSSKQPLVSWERYQRELANPAQIARWWNEFGDPNVGIVTGGTSNICVIDIDRAEGEIELAPLIQDVGDMPVVATPRGGKHLYFRYPTDCVVRNNCRAVVGCDFRGEGGYVVAPPSCIDGVRYEWVKFLSDVVIPTLPHKYIQYVVNQFSRSVQSMSPEALFEQGQRDNNLFHYALVLLRGGERPENVHAAIKLMVKDRRDIDDNWIWEKINSALRYVTRGEIKYTNDIRDYVSLRDGVFTLRDMLKDLGVPREDYNKVTAILSRLRKDRVIEKVGSRDGHYRKPDREIEEVDIWGVDAHELTVRLPLDIHNIVRTQRKNVIVLAGAPNSGKTAFVLNTIYLNKDSFDIKYFFSEMGKDELRDRISMMPVTPQDFGRVKMYERDTNFEDVIDPNAFNIVDYVPIYDEFWKIGSVIDKIHSRLDTGLALVCIQKNSGALLGRGAEFAVERPRLYLSLDNGKVTIVKAKLWVSPQFNPNNQTRRFRIRDFWELVPEGGWYERAV